MPELSEDQLDFAAALLVGNHFAARQIHDSGVDIMPVMRAVRAIGFAADADGNSQNLLFVPMAQYLTGSPVTKPYYFEPGKMDEWEKAAVDTPDLPGDTAEPKALLHSEFELMSAFKEIKQFIVNNFDFPNYQPSAEAIALSESETINDLPEADAQSFAKQLRETQAYCLAHFHVTQEVLIDANIPPAKMMTPSEFEQEVLKNTEDPKTRAMLEQHFKSLHEPQGGTFLFPGVDPTKPVGVLYDVPKADKPATEKSKPGAPAMGGMK